MDREQWTKKLERMVTDIEAGKTPAPVRELYVFGSYARGALECKDLDLVVTHERPSKELMAELKRKAKKTARTFMDTLYGPERRFLSLMRKALWRPGEDMDILFGAELSETLNGRPIQPSDLCLIWSQTDRDWRRKLAAISGNAKAGAAPRGDFMSPKLAQAREEDVRCVTELVREKALTLTRVSADSLDVEALTPDWKQQFARRRWGKKLQTLLPCAFAWIAGQKVECIDIREHGEIWNPERQIRIQLGRLYLYWMFRLFKDKPDLRTQCLIPFFRRAYPKELFVFERGPAWETRTDPWDG